MLMLCYHNCHKHSNNLNHLQSNAQPYNNTEQTPLCWPKSIPNNLHNWFSLLLAQTHNPTKANRNYDWPYHQQCTPSYKQRTSCQPNIASLHPTHNQRETTIEIGPITAVHSLQHCTEHTSLQREHTIEVPT